MSVHIGSLRAYFDIFVAVYIETFEIAFPLYTQTSNLYLCYFIIPRIILIPQSYDEYSNDYY